MTQMTNIRRVRSSDASPHQFPVKPGVKVLEGAVVGLVRGTGTVDNITADPTMIPMGVARHTADNTASLSEVPEAYVDPKIHPMFATGLTGADEGKIAYAVDNQTFSLSSNGGTRPALGFVWEVTSPTSADIRIDPVVSMVLNREAIVGAAEPGVSLTDAAATVVITAGAWRILPAATLTTNRILTLGTTGAVKGDMMTITRLDVTANTYTVNNGGVGAGTLLVMPASKQAFLDAYFDGTNWTTKRMGAV